MPPLVKSVLGASEEVVTAYLAVFSISIAIGSGLAAWLAHGRIVLFPTLVGAALLALFALDLGLYHLWRAAAAREGRRRARCSPRGRASTSRSTSPASRSRAASSSCRRSPPCSPGPAPTSAPASSRPSTCSTRRSSWRHGRRRGPAEVRRDAAATFRAARRRAISWR